MATRVVPPLVLSGATYILYIHSSHSSINTVHSIDELITAGRSTQGHLVPTAAAAIFLIYTTPPIHYQLANHFQLPLVCYRLHFFHTD